jgi:hypothetical protein
MSNKNNKNKKITNRYIKRQTLSHPSSARFAARTTTKSFIVSAGKPIIVPVAQSDTIYMI